MGKEFSKYRILVVDDEEDICEILHYNLEQNGYEVVCASSAEEALFKLKEKFHLILLDIMMDGISGLKMAQLLREEYYNNIPIIFLSALDSENDILSGFEKGCDDYIPKPFSIKEVIARVNAVLTRSNTSHQESDSVTGSGNRNSLQTETETEQAAVQKNEKVIIGKLTIDFAGKRVYVNNEEIILTKKENDILMLLAKSQNKIFSREEILQLVWKNESFVLDRTVDVHIARLRKKLGKYGNMIINRSGYGYSLQPTDDE